MTGQWTIYVADQTGVRQAQVDSYESAEVLARTNDVSTWSLTLPTDTEAGQLLATDTFARVEIALDDVVWRSGPITHLERTVDLDGDMLKVTGADDTVWISRRVAHPEPLTTQPPYSTSAYDVQTGPASQVLARLVDRNLGPGGNSGRRVPGLTVPTPAPLGPNVTVSARWQNLLQLMKDTARGAGLLFDIVDLAFRVRQPADAGVIFSQGLETLGGWRLTSAAPSSNYEYVAGGGQGTARLIVERSDATSMWTWGRAESFIDRRDTTSTADLGQAGLDALAQSVTPTTVVFTPLDTEGQAFGRDWNLGDVVTVVAGGLTVVDQIREIHVTLDDKPTATIVPSVGAPSGDLGLFRALAGLDKRVRQLERV